MCGAMRHLGEKAKVAMMPIAFAAFLPMCSTSAEALPRGMKVNHAMLSEEARSQHEIYAGMRVAAGAMVLHMACAGKNEARNFQALKNLSKKMQGGKGEIREKIRWISREASILRAGKDFSMQKKKALVFGSLFQNAANLCVLYKSDKKSVSEYLASFQHIGFPDVGVIAEQWLKNGNSDIILLLKGLRSCP